MTGTRPLLIFDSGVGGLSVLREVKKRLPKAPIVYAADNAGYPYGTKTAAVLEARIPALAGRDRSRQFRAPARPARQPMCVPRPSPA